MFIEVAEKHPRFLRRQLAAVAAAMLQVGREMTAGRACVCLCLWCAGALGLYLLRGLPLGHAAAAGGGDGGARLGDAPAGG